MQGDWKQKTLIISKWVSYTFLVLWIGQQKINQKALGQWTCDYVSDSILWLSSHVRSPHSYETKPKKQVAEVNEEVPPFENLKFSKNDIPPTSQSKPGDHASQENNGNVTPILE